MHNVGLPSGPRPRAPRAGSCLRSAGRKARVGRLSWPSPMARTAWVAQRNDAVWARSQPVTARSARTAARSARVLRRGRSGGVNALGTGGTRGVFPARRGGDRAHLAAGWWWGGDLEKNRRRSMAWSSGRRSTVAPVGSYSTGKGGRGEAPVQ
jgi:hypothetical protein